MPISTYRQLEGLKQEVEALSDTEGQATTEINIDWILQDEEASWTGDEEHELPYTDELVPWYRITQDDRYVYQDDQGPRNRETSEHFTPRVEYPVLSYSIVPGFKSHIGAAPQFFFSEINLSIPGAVVLSKNIELGFHYTYPLRDDYEALRIPL